MDRNATQERKESIVLFIQKYRIVFVILLAIIAIGLVSAIVIDEVTKGHVANASKLVEKVEAAYNEWTSASEETDKQTKEQAFETAYSEAIAFGGFVAQRAEYLKGHLLYEKKEYQGAEERFILSYELNKTSYLAPVALMNAAAASENLGNFDVALNRYKEISENYAKDSAQAPRALFNSGRLLEKSELWTEAQQNYQKIVDEYVASNWTKLARDRIIYLKVQEKI